MAKIKGYGSRSARQEARVRSFLGKGFAGVVAVPKGAGVVVYDPSTGKHGYVLNPLMGKATTGLVNDYRWPGVKLGRKTHDKAVVEIARLPRELMPIADIASAYEPSARAVALLEGKRIIAADLEAAGGTFDLEQTRLMLNGVSRQAVNAKVKAGHLLVVPGPGKDLRYPTAQFMADGNPIPGIKAVRDALPTKNPWAILNYLVRPDSLLGGRKPIDVLKAGQVDHVVEAARRYGEMGS